MTANTPQMGTVAHLPLTTSKHKACSQVTDLHFLSPHPITSKATPILTPPSNGTMHMPSYIMKVVLSSTAEAKLSDLFLNAKDACVLYITLDNTGHPKDQLPSKSTTPGLQELPTVL